MIDVKKIENYIHIADINLLLNNVIDKTNCSNETKATVMFCWDFLQNEIKRQIAEIENKKIEQNKVDFLKLVLLNTLRKPVTYLFQIYLEPALNNLYHYDYARDNEIIYCCNLNGYYQNEKKYKSYRKQLNFFLNDLQKIAFAIELDKRIKEIELNSN